MKIKLDFITNSSSANFYVMLDRLEKWQIGLIWNHIEASHLFGYPGHALYNRTHDEWQIKQDHERIEGWTSMDNFDMSWFLEKIGIDLKDIYYDGQ